MLTIRVFISGRGYQAAASAPAELTLPEGATVSDAVARLAACLPEGAGFPRSCLVAVSGEHLGALANYRDRALRSGDELALIAPVAGG